MNRTIINIISGKGGTGKTLLASVLADMLGNTGDTKVLIVDLDFFVRGLTSLLYFHREEKLHIVPKDELTVSSFFIKKLIYPNPNLGKIAIAKYRSFDVMPAVTRIDERLNYQDLGPDNVKEAEAILQNLLNSIPQEYRFVILDSRAGYDELISATHRISDVSICVEEQDAISRVTADNLVSQLSNDTETPIFRLVNKARGVTTDESLINNSRSVADLGVIPFDMDILRSFGTKEFWDRVSTSLYRWALARAWNVLNSKLQLGVELTLPRLSPVANEKIEARIGMLALRERILFLYGIVLAVGGVTYGLFGRDILAAFRDDPTRFASLGAGLFGLIIALFAFLRKP